VLATGIAAVMYEDRFAQFTALRKEQHMVARLAETNESLQEAMSALTDAQDRMIHSEKMASLGRFATGLAHELRNPLNFTLNFSKVSSELVDELVQNRSDSDDGSNRLADLKANLGFILKHAQRAESIVGELVGQSGMSPSKPMVTDLNNLIGIQIAAVSSQYRETSPEQTVKVTESFDPDVGSVELLTASFAQAIRNVLDNAFQAAIAGAGSTKEEAGTVSVTTERNGDRIIIVIRDNGVGIDPDALDHIFEPFFTTKPTGVGPGLGLSIVYEVITDGHGGCIEVDSAQGEGTKVRIEIPDSET
jgi:signal transduction histidine kinase